MKTFVMILLLAVAIGIGSCVTSIEDDGRCKLPPCPEVPTPTPPANGGN